jgi:hypothetical protein
VIALLLPARSGDMAAGLAKVITGAAAAGARWPRVPEPPHHSAWLAAPRHRRARAAEPGTGHGPRGSRSPCRRRARVACHGGRNPRPAGRRGQQATLARTQPASPRGTTGRTGGAAGDLSPEGSGRSAGSDKRRFGNCKRCPGQPKPPALRLQACLPRRARRHQPQEGLTCTSKTTGTARSPPPSSWWWSSSRSWPPR